MACRLFGLMRPVPVPEALTSLRTSFFPHPCRCLIFRTEMGDIRTLQLGYIHSNSFVDVNGDCLADLVLTSSTTPSPLSLVSWTCFLTLASASTGPTFNVHLALGSGGYDLAKPAFTTTAPVGTGLLTWGDFGSTRSFPCPLFAHFFSDRDGTIDVLFPVCEGVNCAKENSLRIFYNVQLKICQYHRPSLFRSTSHPRTLFDSGCRKAAEQCTADARWKFEDFSSEAGRVRRSRRSAGLSYHQNVVIVPRESFGENEHFAVPSNVPIRVSPGDYDLDGFIDLLIITSDGSFLPFFLLPTSLLISSLANRTATTTIWRSVPCSTVVGCTPGMTRRVFLDGSRSEATSAGRRTFIKAPSSQAVHFADVSGVERAAFFDFDEDVWWRVLRPHADN